MDSQILEVIKKGIITALNSRYGYCGVAEMDHKTIINSGGDGEDLVITLEEKKGGK